MNASLNGILSTWRTLLSEKKQRFDNNWVFVMMFVKNEKWFILGLSFQLVISIKNMTIEKSSHSLCHCVGENMLAFFYVGFFYNDDWYFLMFNLCFQPWSRSKIKKLWKNSHNWKSKIQPGGKWQTKLDIVSHDDCFPLYRSHFHTHFLGFLWTFSYQYNHKLSLFVKEIVLQRRSEKKDNFRSSAIFLVLDTPFDVQFFSLRYFSSAGEIGCVFWNNRTCQNMPRK